MSKPKKKVYNYKLYNAETGSFYAYRRAKANPFKKLSLKKFDKKTKKHQIFVEKVNK